MVRSYKMLWRSIPVPLHRHGDLSCIKMAWTHLMAWRRITVGSQPYIIFLLWNWVFKHCLKKSAEALSVWRDIRNTHSSQVNPRACSKLCWTSSLASLITFVELAARLGFQMASERYCWQTLASYLLTTLHWQSVYYAKAMVN